MSHYDNPIVITYGLGDQDFGAAGDALAIKPPPGVSRGRIVDSHVAVKETFTAVTTPAYIRLGTAADADFYAELNLGTAAGGANIDLSSASTTAEQIENFVNNVLGKALDDNNLTGRRLNIYISPEIARNWDRPYSGATGFKEGSIRDVLLKNRRIAKIVDTFKLTGNAFFGFVADPLFIRPLVGMAVSTIANPRTMPRDNYNFLVAGALGIEVRTDYAGRGGVFYSVVVNA
jgi:hypothetical protein